MRLGKVRFESEYLAIQYFYENKGWSIRWMCQQLGITRTAYYKGFSMFYYKENLDITYTGLVSRKAHRVNAFVYIMQEGRPFGIPSHMYVSTCSQGYTDFGFNQETLAAAYAFSKKETLKQWDIIL